MPRNAGYSCIYEERDRLSNQPTAPSCIVEECDELSALTSTAKDQFFAFTTYYCAAHYEALTNGDDLPIDVSRVILDRVTGPSSST